ncbi:Rpn family recombination-promoting nuclease/putative transposase [Halomonas sp. MCCC 1A11062]|uniref:Rpn family recombination-promoting nuclease/putative transposase n=1 Tax=Halomonas sp. MCCC 1A11062 TaxID=2733485 RepID=UPI001F254427|nr:Rpn family recombination-promoting nuclease/putative transposase [Halomonas sp. MCCC 1A11062]MCE8038906.1 Rpn family recombination-promoting nuclease/putative transposase [Halomonas sp. MCCC 1A11062]
MAGHDNSYKLLFSHQRMVRDLLTGFVHEKWVEELDLDSLEKASGSYVTDELRDRESDIVWRVRWGDTWLYVYLLIEFQSRVDRFMPVRIMSYVGLLYQDLIRQKAFTPSGKLPPVLPIVLYNGERRWNAAQDVAEMVENVSGGLEKYCPTVRYLLLDEKAIVNDPDWPEETRNVVAALFNLEHYRGVDEALNVLGRLVEWLYSEPQEELRNAFTSWLKQVWAKRQAPKEHWQELNRLEDLREVYTMLQERTGQWPKRWKQEGREEGREEALRSTARNLIQTTDLSDRAIADATGLPLDDVKAMRDELQH